MQSDNGIRYTSATDVFFRTVFAFINNPMSFLSLVGGGLSTYSAANGWKLPGLGEVLILTLAFMFVIASISFLVWALPKTYHILISATLSGIFSLLTVSWCLNYENTCKTYYVITENKTFQLQTAFGEFLNKILG